MNAGQRTVLNKQSSFVKSLYFILLYFILCCKIIFKKFLKSAGAELNLHFEHEPKCLYIMLPKVTVVF
jgi:hypothetical protein